MATQDKNSIKAVSLRDRKDNPFYMPRERYEVRFADVVSKSTYALMVGRSCAVFSHANGDEGERHRRTISEWCDRTVAGKWTIGIEAVFFENADDAMMCKLSFT
jgi:hypothetical protein